MKYTIEITDRLPNGKLQTLFVVGVKQDKFGHVDTFETGSRENAVAFDDRAIAKDIAQLILDFDFDYTQPTFVGLRLIEL